MGCSTCGSKYRRNFQRNFSQPVVIPANSEPSSQVDSSGKPLIRKIPGYLRRRDRPVSVPEVKEETIEPIE